jgi:hypothetical protein
LIFWNLKLDKQWSRQKNLENLGTKKRIITRVKKSTAYIINFNINSKDTWKMELLNKKLKN